MHRHIQNCFEPPINFKTPDYFPEIIFYVVRSKDGATISLL